MRRIRGCASVALCFVILTGCATRANYEKILNSWVGAPAENLVRSWGAPISTFRMSSGNEIYIYDKRRSTVVTMPVQVQQNPGIFVGNMYYPGQTMVTGGQVIPIHLSCRTEFEVNQTGTIVRWRHEGNACVARSQD